MTDTRNAGEIERWTDCLERRIDLYERIGGYEYTGYHATDDAAILKLLRAALPAPNTGERGGPLPYKTDFSPGPWTVEEYGDDEAPNLVIHKDSENRVCFMVTRGSQGNPDNIEADARLIAAAPDLYHALQECLLDHGGFTIRGGCERRARAALARAALKEQADK